MRSAWSPARWVWPASGPDSIVSSPCGPELPGVVEGRAGIAMVSGSGGVAAGGCQAGMSVVGSRSASLGGGATIVAATSAAVGDGADHGTRAGSGETGSTAGGSGGATASAAPAAAAPAARSASVEGAEGADGEAAAAAADQTGAGAFHGGACTAGGWGAGAGGAAGALHEGAGGAAGSSVL